MGEPFPIHFVLGTGRCGSSLLHELICRHPAVRFISNVDDRLALGSIGRRWNSAAHRLLPPSASRKGRARFAPSEGYRAAQREIGPLLAMSFRDPVAADATPWMASRIDGFFRRRHAVRGDGTFVHKWTGWPRAGLMHAVFPEARFVNVVRDGRAVANSWLQMPWWRGYEGPEHWQWGPLDPAEQDEWDRRGRSFPVLAALLWAKLVDAADAARDALPGDQWLDVRYEDLIADPRRIVADALAFLQLDEDAAVTGEIDRYRFDPSRAEAFHRDLGATIVEEITDVMAGPLKRHGYLSEGGSP
ncbi:MAG: sulfotransferase [Acidimicrobiia bacterium]|nr:sulfotransferase [Acidimicrobiia bacterium]